MDCCMPGFPVLHHLPEFLKLMSTELVMPSNHLILCIPFSSCLQFFPASGSFPISLRFPWGGIGSFSISPFSEYSELISFSFDWFDFLAVQGPLKSLLQNHSLKASVLWCSAFFIIQLSYPYKTTRKTIALTMRTFVGKIMSLLFKMLSRFVIALLPRGLPCVARTVMNLSAMWKTWAQSLGWEDPLEKEMEPTPVFLPGESHGQRSLVELQSIGSQKSDTMEHLTLCFYFMSKEQVSFNFVAIVTVYSDFGAQGNKICHCFHFSPLYLSWSDGTRCHDLSFLNVEF